MKKFARAKEHLDGSRSAPNNLHACQIGMKSQRGSIETSLHPPDRKEKSMTAKGRYPRIQIVALLVALGGMTFVLTTALSQQNSGWPEWGQDQTHIGTVNVAGQNLNRILANIVYDPFIDQEKAPENGDGDLLVHYQTPLVDGNDVYMEFKTGTYTSITTWETQTWNEKKLSWVGGSLVEQWNFQSDWKPVPYGSASWEPVFHATLAGDFVYVPGAGGTAYKLSKATGAVIAQYNPIGPDTDHNIFTTG